MQNSPNVTVANNTIVVGRGGGNGIGLILQPRGTGLFGPHLTLNARVEDNVLVFLGSNYSGSGSLGAVTNCNQTLGVQCDDMFSSAAWDGNHYYFATDSTTGSLPAQKQERFRWGGESVSTASNNWGTVPSIIERRPALFFLGHISPIFARLFAIFSLFSPS